MSRRWNRPWRTDRSRTRANEASGCAIFASWNLRTENYGMYTKYFFNVKILSHCFVRSVERVVKKLAYRKKLTETIFFARNIWIAQDVSDRKYNNKRVFDFTCTTERTIRSDCVLRFFNDNVLAYSSANYSRCLLRTEHCIFGKIAIGWCE